MEKEDMTRKALRNKSLRNSIQARITLIIILTSTVVFAGFALYDYFVTSAELNKDFDNLAEYIVDQQAKSLALPLWYMDSKSVKDVMSSAMIEKQVYAVIIRNESGIVYGEMRENNLNTVGISKEISGDYYVKKKAISKNDEKLGTVEVYLTPEFMQKKLDDATASMLIAILILNISLVSVLLYSIRKSVILPVSHVAENIRAIASGHLDIAIHTERMDEIGQLVSDVESMRLTIKGNLELVRKQNETLRESEERFRIIAMNTPDHILIQDKDLRYVWVLNPQLGLTEKDMIGKTDFDLTSKEDAAILTEIKTRVLGTGNPEFVKIPLVSLKGDMQHFEGSYIPRHDEEGKIDGLIGYFRNVTDRVKGEKALKESEERYRKILENVLVGVYQVTLDGKFIFANQKMAEMFGFSSYEELEAVGSIAELYARPEERHKIVDEIINKGFINDEFEYRRKDGQSIWVKLNTRKTTNKEGAIILEGLMEDITEIKKMENQLHQAQKMEAVGTLAGGIAHDFNNILAIILGNAELASDDVPDSNPASQSLKEIRKASIRAKDMIKQLLAFSRKTDEENNPINMAPIIKESMKMLRSAIPTSVEFKQHISDDPCSVMGDAAQINQIMMNLVTNAADAMSEKGGLLEVTLENIILQEEKSCFDWVLSPGAYVRLMVRDTGEGIEPRIMDRIFEPYYTTKEVGKGTGMGLSVIHGIVKRHGGGIRVESGPGKGTVFEIYFPVLEKTIEEEKKPGGEIKGGSERILFVDDEESLVDLNRQRLERLGYHVKSTTKPEEALEWFKADPDQFDVIITDMTMPRMTGDRLAAEVLKIRPHIPVIICTGYSERMSAKKAEALGVRKYIEKPINYRNLASALREVLEEKQVR